VNKVVQYFFQAVLVLVLPILFQSIVNNPGQWYDVGLRQKAQLDRELVNMKAMSSLVYVGQTVLQFYFKQGEHSG